MIHHLSSFTALIISTKFIIGAYANSAPKFVHDMNDLRISPSTKPGSTVYQLVGVDDESEVYYAIQGMTASDQGYFAVDRRSGTVTLLRRLDTANTPRMFKLLVSLEDLPIDTNPPNKVQRQVQVFVETNNPVGILKTFEWKWMDAIQLEFSKVPTYGADTETQNDKQRVHDKLAASAAAPLFSSQSASIRVPENWPIGVPLPVEPALFVGTNNKQTRIRLAIAGSSFAVNFNVVPTELPIGSGFFDIVPNSIAALDVESLRTDTLKLEVIATELASGKSSKLPVSVQIQDVDEFPISFSSGRYDMELPSNVQDKALIGAMEVVDLDYGARQNTQLQYRLFGAHTQYFELVTPEPDVVELHYSACRELCEMDALPPQFDLILRAIDENGRFADTTISVTMVMKDSRAPRFDVKHYEVKLDEQSTEFRPTLRVHATDADNSTIAYELQDQTGLFAIDRDTGIISVAHPEYVTIDNLGVRFNLTALASDGMNPPASVNVIVEIVEQQQARNRPPKFIKPNYQLEVPLPSKRSAGNVLAADQEGAVTYSIAEGGAGYFRIDTNSGELKYMGPLIKTDSVYQLKVVAYDTATPPKFDTADVQVTVKGIGSGQPKFMGDKTVTVTIKQDAQPHTLHSFAVMDPDLDADLLLSVDQVVAYDRLGQQWAPEDVEQQRRLKELVNFVSSTVPRDGKAELQLTPDARLRDFPGVLSLHVTVTVLDKAHPLEPADQATVIINVQPMAPVEASPDQLLQFVPIPSEVTIPETLSAGSYVYTVAMRPVPKEKQPKDPKIKYNLVHGQEWLSIDSETGVLRLTKSLSDSRKPVDTIPVTVAATHIASDVTNTVAFKLTAQQQNNQAPKFLKPSYDAELSENAALQSMVLQIAAKDKDIGDQLMYSLSGEHAALFAIDNEGFITALRSFDREKTPVLNFVLHAKDESGREAQAPVRVRILDVNDHRPIFARTQYAESVTENVALNSHLVQVEAHDADEGDNGSIVYSLLNVQPENLREALSIDPSRGIIRNTRPLTGFGQPTPYRIGVVARDGQGLNASTIVFLTVTSSVQCRPEFTHPMHNQTVLTIAENLAPGQVATRLQASTSRKSLELDCQISYVIWDADKQDYVHKTNEFALDENTGDLTSLISFDRETKQRYSLVVAAQSGAIYTRMSIEVRISDVDDNSPEFAVREFTFELPEDVNSGVEVTVFEAEDADTQQFGRVFYHLIVDDNNMRLPFELDARTGLLTVNGQLDRETQHMYKIFVLASNSATSPSAVERRTALNERGTRRDVVAVTILVTDVNDNGPVFSQPLYRAVVPKNASVGTVLTQVHARDPDISDASNGQVVYDIVETVYHYKDLQRPFDGMLTIDSKSGELSVAEDLNEYDQGVFHVKVQSADGHNASNAQTDVALVKVYVFNPAEQLIRVVLRDRPELLTRERSEQIMHTLSNSINATGIMNRVAYHRGATGRTEVDKVDVTAVFVNRSDDTVLMTEQVLHRVDTSTNQFLLKEIDVEMVLAANAPLYAASSKGLDVAAVALIVFAIVLILGLLIFVLLLCYYRKRWLRRNRKLRVTQPLKLNADHQPHQVGSVMSKSTFQPQHSPGMMMDLNGGAFGPSPMGTTRSYYAPYGSSYSSLYGTYYTDVIYRSNPLWPTSPQMVPPGTKSYEAQEFTMDVFGGGGTVRSHAASIGISPLFFNGASPPPVPYDDVDAASMTEFRPSDLNVRPNFATHQRRPMSADPDWYAKQQSVNGTLKRSGI